MKKRITRILGVAMTVILLVGLFVAAAPLSAGTNSWSAFGVPTTTGMVLDTGNATGPMVMGSDGTIWAGRGTGNTGGLMTSTDFGATWAMNTAYAALTTATNIMDIVVSSIDPLQVYVTDGVDIYKTADGGTTWVTLSALVTAFVGDLITSIDVGYIGANAYIFAGTSAFGGGTGGGVFVAQEAVFGMPWTDMDVDSDRATTWTQADITEVIVDPVNFGTTQMVMAVGDDATGGITKITTKYSGAQWGATVADVSLPGVTGTVYNTSTWLPDDFSSTLASGTMQCFIGVNAFTDTQGDVFWVVFGTPGAAFDLNVNGAAGFGVTSLDGIGPGSNASMLASGFSAAANGVPVVMASSVGGAVWTANVKGPSGAASPLFPTTDALSQVLIDPVTGNAIVATHGVNSAVSASSDWAVWNGISLINTTITNITDLFANSDFVAMVTNNGTVDSLWTRATGSTSWLRILDSNTSGWNFDTYEYVSGADFLTNMGGTAIWRSLTGGATWTALVSAAPGAITAWLVVDANTIMVGGTNQVFQTTNGGVVWFTRTATALGVVQSFALNAANGDIVAGSASTGAGKVAVSSDNGATWAVSTNTITAAATSLIVAFGSSGKMYATDTVAGGVYSRTTGSWSTLDDGASTMTVAAGAGIVAAPGVAEMVYTADGSAAGRGVARVRTDDGNAEPMAGPAATTFAGLWYSPGSNVLWTIGTGGTADPNIYSWTDTINVAGSGVAVAVGVTTAANTATATVTWDALANATGYVVVVNPTAQTARLTAANGAGVAVVVSGTTATVTGLVGVTTYNVSVWGTAASGAVSSFLFGGAVVPFTTDPTAPVAPVGLVPLPGATGVPITPAFQWAPVPGALSYELELSDEPDFATIQATMTGPFYAWGSGGEADLEYSTNYYWRARAVTATGTSTWVTSIFTTLAEPVDPVDVTDTTQDITLVVPEAETPAYIWAIIAVGFVLTLAVIILIVRTRRVV